MVGRLASILAALLQFLRSPAPPHARLPFPALRNIILDVLAEGRQKNLIHLLFEADVTAARTRLAREGQRVSFTAFVAKAFADAVDEDRSVQACRRGSQLVVFADVDLCAMVECEVEGATLPLRYIVRAANRKDAAAIDAELQAAKGGRGCLSKLERDFFSLPAPVRRLFWSLIRRDPALTKELMGTVGVTSMGMFAAGPAVVIPISPMTLTLSIGGIERRVVLEEGRPVERERVRLNLTADHDVLDGAPLMRFADRFRQRLEEDRAPAAAPPSR